MPDSKITKKALAASMKDLMAEKPFTKINIGEICENCQMNRKSFYYHFKDKYDLVNWIFQSEFADNVTDESYEDFWALLLGVGSYLYNNRRFYVHALEVFGQNSFRDYFPMAMRPHFLVYMKDQFGASRYFTDLERQEVFAEFFADAFLVSIEKWIVHHPDLTPERYVDLMDFEGGKRNDIFKK